MRVAGVLLGLLLCAAAVYAVLEAAAPSRREVQAPTGPWRRRPVPSAERVDEAIRRGVAYLVEAQNKDGSWGSTASNLWDIYAPVPGSFYAFSVASSALAVSALLEAGGDDPRAAEAARRGLDFLLTHHTKARRVSDDVLYNVWAQAYALEAFSRALARERSPARREALLAACREDVDLLGRFEFVDGGWGYYNFGITVQHPAHGATTFTTATVLAAMRMAADQGVAIPRRLVDRGLALLELCRRPDWAFAYSWEHRYHPQGGINHPQGSLARTPACEVALDDWGARVPRERMVEALERLDEKGYFLRLARKYPIPHETWYQNSGYFCFYGYYYASRLLARIPAEEAAARRGRIAADLLPLQEQDGSWWDYQLYSYHKAYGTGFVLLALAAARR